MSTLISLIIPVYNLEKIISNTLVNLFSQINSSFEIIIIDDGSIDNTYSEITNLCEQYQQLQIKIFQQEKKGVSSARNLGIMNAIGKYVLFLDGDDSLNISKKLIDVINNSNSEMLVFEYTTDKYSKQNHIIFDSKLDENVPYNGFNLLNEKFKHKIKLDLWTSSVIFSRSFLVEYGLLFDPNVKIGQIFLFFHQALLNAKSVSFYRINLSTYIIRSDSSTNSIHTGLLDILLALDKLYKFIKSKGKLNILIHIGLIRNYIGKIIEISKLIRHLTSNKNQYFERLYELISSTSIFNSSTINNFIYYIILLYAK